jgi:hypothetical protein
MGETRGLTNDTAKKDGYKVSQSILFTPSSITIAYHDRFHNVPDNACILLKGVHTQLSPSNN